MTAINDLTRVSSLVGGDIIPVWITSQGGPYGVSFTDFTASITDTASEVKQYSTPLTAATVTVGQSDDTWLILTPAGTLATLTVNLGATPADMQEVIVTSSQIITALTVTSTGSTVGQPTAMAANGFFRMKYDAVMTTWRRVG